MEDNTWFSTKEVAAQPDPSRIPQPDASLSVNHTITFEDVVEGDGKFDFSKLEQEPVVTLETSNTSATVESGSEFRPLFRSDDD